MTGLTASEPGTDDLATAFATVATMFSGATTVEELAALIVSLAVSTIEGCELAGVMARQDGRAVTLAASEEPVRALDQLQVDAEEGPCLDVLAGRPAEYAADLATGDRWPRFGGRAALAGVRSLLAVGVGADDSPAALNLYARLPDAFGPVDRGQAAIFATHARLALGERRQRNHDAATEAQLREALAMRDVIGQAQGILMERDRISARQAFDVLRRASQHLNIKLRDVAQALVDTGEDPDTGPARR
jgi:hypothetical protein